MDGVSRQSVAQLAERPRKGRSLVQVQPDWFGCDTGVMGRCIASMRGRNGFESHVSQRDDGSIMVVSRVAPRDAGSTPVRYHVVESGVGFRR